MLNGATLGSCFFLQKNEASAGEDPAAWARKVRVRMPGTTGHWLKKTLRELKIAMEHGWNGSFMDEWGHW